MQSIDPDNCTVKNLVKCTAINENTRNVYIHSNKTEETVTLACNPIA